MQSGVYDNTEWVVIQEFTVKMFYSKTLKENLKKMCPFV